MANFATIFIAILSLASLAAGNAVTPNELKDIFEFEGNRNAAESLRSVMQATGSNVEIEGSVIGGNAAALGQFPYKAALYLRTNDNNVYVCGGTLVRYNWVLSSAFCIRNWREIIVLLGTLRLLGGSEAWRSASIPRHHQFMHPQFNALSFRNNIGMLHLATATESILNHQHIALLPLPTRADASINVVGMNGTFAGYGNYGPGLIGVLHYSHLPMINNTICNDTFPGLVPYDSLCASTLGGGSPCGGDTGSPIVIEIAQGRQVMMGILSYSAGNCSLGLPSVFEDVISHLDWIEETMRGSASAIGLSVTLLSAVLITLFI